MWTRGAPWEPEAVGGALGLSEGMQSGPRAAAGSYGNLCPVAPEAPPGLPA